MASAGNAQDFGDVSDGISQGGIEQQNSWESSRRIAPSNGNNTLEFITIQSTGNSVDFGDCSRR